MQQNKRLVLNIVISVVFLFVHESLGSTKETLNVAENGDDKNAIVLIGLNEFAGELNGYGYIPVLEEDAKNLLNKTLTGQLNGSARDLKTFFTGSNSTDLNASQSRLLSLVTTPKKALLLFALHEALVRANQTHFQKNCVVLSSEDLQNLLNSEANSPRSAFPIHDKVKLD